MPTKKPVSRTVSFNEDTPVYQEVTLTVKANVRNFCGNKESMVAGVSEALSEYIENLEYNVDNTYNDKGGFGVKDFTVTFNE